MQKSFIFSGLIVFYALLGIATIESCRNNQVDQNTGFIFKEKLSDYGFFKQNLRDLKPQTGVLPYELSTPLFTDYTRKDRFIVLPGGRPIRYTERGPLDFPDSTIIVKNFAYTNIHHQKIMLETRLLVKDPFDSKWKVMDYLWDKDQTDAVKHISGAKIQINLLDDSANTIHTTYQVPNTNDCKRCHLQNNELTPLGPKARNLNFTVEGQPNNQLVQWASLGLLSGIADISQVSQLPNWRDEKHFTLEQRARAYLDVNCAHCHAAGGDASNTGLFLDYEQHDPFHLGIMKAPVSAGGGAGGLDYDILPGDVAHSILVYRMNSNEPGTAMPELARTIIHTEGVNLIAAWVSQLSSGKKPSTRR